MTELMHLPAVDYTKLMENDSNELKVLNNAAREYGFFRLHNVPALSEEVLRVTLQEIEGFFRLSLEEKMSMKRTEKNPFGYNDAEMTKQRKDWKEIYDIGPERDSLSEETGTNQWPEDDKLPNFKLSMQNYFEVCSSVSLNLLGMLAKGLGADVEACANVVETYKNHTSYLRLNHYPICSTAAPENTPTIFDEKWGDLAVGRHTDAGGVTILLMDGVKGLQMERDGVWHTIDNARHDLIINIGDMIQVMSNDTYIAPLHRVIASVSNERFSAPFFLNPSWESIISPLTCCVVDPQEGAKYRPLSWKEFRSLRALGDYKDAGEEIQISKYRIKT